MSVILVTGAAGFIGYHLSERLLAQGATVIGLDNLNDYYDVQLKKDRLERLKRSPRFQLFQMDLADREKVAELFKTHRPERVVNLAAQAGVRYSLENPHVYMESNIIGFLNILEGCRHNDVKHLVFASSSSVYGANTKIPFSSRHNVDHPVSLYAASKKSNELMAHCYSHLYKIPATGLRFFTVYGPWGRPDMALFLFTKAILADQPIEVFNHGKMRRDFTYVDDVVEGIVRVLERTPAADTTWDSDSPDPSTSKSPYRIYNIGNNQPVELLHLIEVLEEALGKKAVKNMKPMQPGDVPETFADVDDLMQATGFRPDTPIEQGVRQFVEWYREYHKV